MNWSPGSEREALAAFLDKQRDILVRKIEGVTDEDARKTPTASSLSLLGIPKHCALMHHIEEVARHAGHADIIRETIDGSTGE
jgi:Protein of unknown function (DUF664)